MLFLFIFFIVDTAEIDSEYQNALIYDKKDLHAENYHTVYFKNLNVYEITELLNQVDVDVLSYQIDENKYYISNNNIAELIKKYTQNMNIEDKLYYETNGFNIKAISLICETSELIKLEKLTSVF